MLGPYQTIPALFTCATAVQAVMVMLESTEKRRILMSPYNTYAKESTSGTYSRSVFFWLTSLFIMGYQKILKLDDLYPLDHDLSLQPLQEQMQAAWDKVQFLCRSLAHLRLLCISSCLPLCADSSWACSA